MQCHMQILDLNRYGEKFEPFLVTFIMWNRNRGMVALENNFTAIGTIEKWS